MRVIFFLFFLINLNSIICINPVIYLHGIDNNCPGEVSGFNNTLTSIYPEIYARCVETGPDFYSYTRGAETMVDIACKIINKDDNVKGNFTLIGFSQGGLLSRLLIQRCNFIGKQVSKFISIAGPQMGVSIIPECRNELNWAKEAICWIGDYLARLVIRLEIIQNIFCPLGYFKNHLDDHAYFKHSLLAKWNNEREYSEKQKQNFLKLEKAMFIKFNQDSVIIPKESTHFGLWDNKENIIKMEDTNFYKEDLIGIKTLKESGRAIFYEWEGEHVEVTSEEIEKFIAPFLI